GDASPRRADEIAEPIDGADGRVVERRDEGRARQVRRMMLDKAGARSDPRVIQAEGVGEDGGQRADPGHVARARGDGAARPMLEEKPRLAQEMRARVA